MRVALIATSTVVSLLMVEGFLRLRERLRNETPTASTFDEAIYTFDPARHHRLIPNGRYRHASYEFDYVWANNSLGMRDREHPLRKPPETFRIFVLGDSFIQGYGVLLEETMVHRLETGLNQPGRPAIEVLNGGIFGYSPMLEYAYLHEVIDSLQPDLVIVAFFLGNDVGDDNFYHRTAHFAPDGETFSFDDHRWPWSLIADQLERKSGSDSNEASAASDGGGPPTLRDVLRQSRTLALLKNRFGQRSYPEHREREFALVREHRGDIRYDLAAVNYPVRTREERLAWWGTSLDYLAKIAALCRAHDARMVLLVIPPLERFLGETDLAEPYDILEDFGRRLSVPVINLLPEFVADDPQSLYYKFDRHWNRDGHRVAAGIVERKLRGLNVLPGQ